MISDTPPYPRCAGRSEGPSWMGSPRPHPESQLTSLRDEFLRWPVCDRPADQPPPTRRLHLKPVAPATWPTWPPTSGRQPGPAVRGGRDPLSAAAGTRPDPGAIRAGCNQSSPTCETNALSHPRAAPGPHRRRTLRPHAVLTVTDTGIGIRPPETAPHTSTGSWRRRPAAQIFGKRHRLPWPLTRRAHARNWFRPPPARRGTH